MITVIVSSFPPERATNVRTESRYMREVSERKELLLNPPGRLHCLQNPIGEAKGKGATLHEHESDRELTESVCERLERTHDSETGGTVGTCTRGSGRK